MLIHRPSLLLLLPRLPAHDTNPPQASHMAAYCRAIGRTLLAYVLVVVVLIWLSRDA